MNETNQLVNHLWKDGRERGGLMLEFIRQQLPEFTPSRVLEIGIGGGGIGMTFAASGARVVCGDLSQATLSHVQQRIAKESSLNLKCGRFDMRALPFASNTFDLVLLNGVLEYAGLGKSGGPRSPEYFQQLALLEAFRVLRPGGWLYLGIENRLYPMHWVRDPHTSQPIVAILPRRWANRLSTMLNGGPYEHWIHSLRSLRKLVSGVGFKNLQSFLTVPSYQFPLDYVSSGTGLIRERGFQKFTASNPSADLLKVCSMSWRGKLLLKLFYAIPLLGYWGGCHVLLCQRSK